MKRISMISIAVVLMISALAAGAEVQKMSDACKDVLGTLPEGRRVVIIIADSEGSSSFERAVAQSMKISMPPKLHLLRRSEKSDIFVETQKALKEYINGSLPIQNLHRKMLDLYMVLGKPSIVYIEHQGLSKAGDFHTFAITTLVVATDKTRFYRIKASDVSKAEIFILKEMAKLREQIARTREELRRVEREIKKRQFLLESVEAKTSEKRQEFSFLKAQIEEKIKRAEVQAKKVKSAVVQARVSAASAFDKTMRRTLAGKTGEREDYIEKWAEEGGKENEKRVIWALFNDSDVNVRETAAKELREFAPSKTSLIALKDAAESEVTANAREDMLEAIGHFGDKSMVPFLQKFASYDPDEGARDMAREAIDELLGR